MKTTWILSALHKYTVFPVISARALTNFFSNLGGRLLEGALVKGGRLF